MTLPAHFRTIGILVVMIGLCWSGPTMYGQAKSKQKQTAPTVDDAKAFITSAEKRLLDLWIKAQRAQWVQSNFITDDTEQMAADAQRDVVSATLALAADATQFDGIKLPADTKRRLMLLKLSLTLPAPQAPADQAELTKIAVSLESDYGRGIYCPDGKEGKCYDLNEMSRILATSRDPEELQKMWTGWRTIAPPMRDRYTRLVGLANKGARDLGFADLGAMWRSNYDMSPREFNTEMERLWQQVKPLYDALHAYVRWKLAEHYGTDVVPEDGLIPAHLLGNMWSQTWDNIYPLVAPENDQRPYDLTAILKDKDLDAITMARYGERFFVSLGFDPLPETFWKRSLFVKPADRDVVCHASAWDIDFEKDIRIKMCIEPTEEDFNTIHHELGHNFYQRAYMNQPPLYRDGANDGFHEAIGDLVALSITPDYLHKIGLLEEVPESNGDISLLLKKALEKVAFLPFGYIMDQWRWKVFSGEIKPADYTKAWWQLVERYQGITSPVERTEKDFDPGAKYHIPASVPYARYFLAAILQFQFHRGMLHEIGYSGPLHQGSIYGNTKAGEKLKAMLAMGRSRPWTEALETITGEKKFDASAMLEYFAPLKKWLDEQNQGKKVGF